MKQKYITRNYFFFIYIYIYIYIFWGIPYSFLAIKVRSHWIYVKVNQQIILWLMLWNFAWLVFLINLSSCQCMHAFHGERERERERERDRDSQTESFPLRHDSLNEFLRTKMFFEFDFCTGRTLTWDTRCFARCTLCLVFEKWSKLGMWTHCHCWIRLHVSIRQQKKKNDYMCQSKSYVY